MVGGPDTLVALSDAACQAVSQRLAAPANVRILDAAGELLVVAVHAPDPSVAADIRSAIARAAVPMPIVEAFITGEPVVSRQMMSSSVIVQGLLTRQHIEGLVVAPLRVLGRTIGTMTVARVAGSEVDDDDALHVLVTAALELSAGIEEKGLFDVAVQELGRRALIERRQATLLRHGSDGVFVISRTGRILDVTPPVTAMLGYTRDDIVGRHISDLVDPSELQRELALLTDRVGNARVVELSARHADGSELSVECTAVDLLEDPAIGGFVVTARDVTERHQANELLASENAILAEIAAQRPLEHVLDAIARFVESSMNVLTPMILTADAESRVKVLAAPSMSPKVRAIIEGVVLVDSAVFRERPADMGVLVADSDTDAQWRTEPRKPRHAGGVTRSWSQQIRDPDGRVLGAVCVFVSERREPTSYESHVMELASRLAGIAMAQDRSARAMAHAATHDPLTSLPNRTMLVSSLSHLLERASNDSIAVVFVDLDDFKLVNDTAGHAVGDRLLLAVADRLAAAVRPMDLIARLGGDEFAILCEGLDGDGAAGVAERVLAAFEMPFIVNSQLFHVSASAGIAVGGGANSSPDDMLRDADTAMYEAKRQGRGRHAVFTPEVRATAVRRTTLAHELRRAIAHGGLDVHYQPVVEVRTGRIIGLEALARWNSPSHGDVPPHEFVEIAEAAGLIAPFGATILRVALDQAAKLRGAGLLAPDAQMAVNVSPHQLTDPMFVQTVIDTLARVAFPASCLCLELTESAVMTVEGADEALARLTGLGITVAIDDFGTGHSSLSRLRTLNASVLKLDQSFVLDLDLDPGSFEVAAGVIQLAHALGKRLVVEGVERASQLRLLEQLGADAVQGFYVARPQSADAIEGFLRATPALSV